MMRLPKKPTLSCTSTFSYIPAHSHGEGSSSNYQRNQLRVFDMHVHTEDATIKSSIMQPYVHGDGIDKHISPCTLTTNQNKSHETMIINITDTLNEDKNSHASNTWKLNVNHNTLLTVPSSKEILNHVSNMQATSSVASPPIEYIHMGYCSWKCRHCEAKFWECEKISTSGSGESAIYNKCCNGGQVVLRAPPEYLQYIKNLFADLHFMENIRAYNQMFSMTSLGAKVDTSINNGRGPYLYIYDTNNKVQNRMAHFGGEEQSGLKREIVKGLIDFLDNHNALVQLFRTARNKRSDANIPEFKLRLYSVIGTCRYDMPTPKIIGAIIFDGKTAMESKFDLIVEEHSHIPQRVNKLHPCYMALQFPLLFVYGEEGYQKDMKLVNVPELTTADRADIVDRIFEQKVCDYIKFVRKTKLFSHITAVLYTIEFQKQGLPHCHSLLWVSLSSKVQQDINVDKYISTELPDPAQDPEAYRVISELMIHGPCGYANKNALCMKDGNKCNRSFPKPYCDATYIDKDGFVHYHRRHTYIDTERQQRRRRQNKHVIERLTYIQPNVGDLFYQRLILCHQKGCRSFREIQTVNGIVFQTNKAECEALGLIGGDQEWVIALQEASLHASPDQSRKLCVQILTFYDVSDPKELWQKFWKDMSHDIPRRLSRLLEIPEVEQNKTEMQAVTLFELEGILNSNSRTLKEFGLPMPPRKLLHILEN
uniref:Helitron helicase-like domain-containing protein n=1 Tax=Tanacetum cinerariifolium TaxID=118510 RepID=A0A6L2JI51_TANCI|nr:helitron helicase-like domain-containing protein [Tanacetum cinerariifolium]